jgi:predicted DNA-binding WGR domain protein
VRRWELVGAGSAEFWEVDRDGSDVTVRYGRLGSAGRSRTTSFASAAAASAQVVKLVAEKEKKGYLELGAAPATPVEQQVEPGPPVFTMPASWHPHVHVRRGGRVRRAEVVEPDAVERVRAGLVSALPVLEVALGDPESDQDLVRTARAHLHGDETVIGAAAVCALLQGEHGIQDLLPLMAAAWVAEHGLPFAARATVESCRLEVFRQSYPVTRSVLRRIPPPTSSYSPRWPGEPVAKRVRGFLASAPDTEYDAVVAALEPHRTDWRSMVAAAYLVPTRRDWVDEATDETERSGDHWDWLRLLHSFESPDQLARLARRRNEMWLLSYDEVTHTLVDAMGPDIAASIAPTLTPDIDGDFRDLVLGVLVEFPTAEAFDLLLARLDVKQVLPTVLDMARRYPRLALERFAAGHLDLLKAHLRRYPELADAIDLPEEARAFVAELRAEAAAVEEVPAEALPAPLVVPPWTVRHRAAKPLVVKGLTVPDDRAVAWEPGEQVEWAAATFPHRQRIDDWEAAVERYRAGDLPGHLHEVLFQEGPVDLLRPLVADWRPTVRRYAHSQGKALLGRFGADAIPVVLHFAGTPGDRKREDLVLPVVSAEAALLVARWLVRYKRSRALCTTWVRRHPEHAARFLVPAAVGPAGPDRKAAQAVLWLVPEQARAAAREYGPAAEKALSVDPLDLLPAKVPSLSEWAEPRMLARVRLRGSERVLSLESTRHLLTMLALSTPDDVYAGVEIVREACDPASLARFAWDLFELWQVNGLPSKDSWVLTALGLLGDDQAVRGLTPLIRRWPGEAQHARAVVGLDVLASIGTDTALAALNSIAQRVKFKALRQRAREKIEVVATDLGLTGEQLADRLVPDLGLDDAAATTVDYGPRRFTVGFDEQLKPFVLDETGKRLKELPKPGAKDDPDLAPAEHKRFGRLKKDVRTIAADQIVRLERAMVLRRRWPAAEFRTLLAAHPLLRHVVRRLVWTTEDGRSFRLAEDQTLADAHDDAFDLPDDALVGVAHPLHLGGDLGAWAEVFADYEILQPFEQLGRPVHRLTQDERDSSELKRFADVDVEVGRLLALTKRGWDRGTPMDAGFEPDITRPLPEGGWVVVTLDPGISVGAPQDWPAQRLTGISVDRFGEPRCTFGDLDPVTASELLSELTGLTG